MMKRAIGDKEVHIRVPYFFPTFMFTSDIDQKEKAMPTCGPPLGSQFDVHEGSFSFLAAVAELLCAPAKNVQLTRCLGFHLCFGSLMPMQQHVDLFVTQEAAFNIVHEFGRVGGSQAGGQGGTT